MGGRRVLDLGRDGGARLALQPWEEIRPVLVQQRQAGYQVGMERKAVVGRVRIALWSQQMTWHMPLITRP